MTQATRNRLHFALASFAAAMLALYISLAIGLPKPYWAVITVYIVSHPIAGAVRSKAIYRLLGTGLGAAASVVLVPHLVNAPALLSLALALWVGVCLAVAVLDRSPRSYIMMLAGYTAAIIGFPGVLQPAAIFDVALARAQEIGLGIVCATLVHSLWFPRPVGTVLRARLDAWLTEADQWALDLLRGGSAETLERDRSRLAGAASEIRQLATHLPYDTSRLRETTAVVQALQERLLRLIPLLASLSDRLAALRALRGAPDAETAAALAEVADWVASPGMDSQPLLQRLRRQAACVDRRDWTGLHQLSLLSRLLDLVEALDASRQLLAHLHAPERALPSPLAEVVARAEEQPLHRDPGLAWRSGGAATLSILICCALWILGGWSAGDGAAVLAAVLCCLFATMDDPAPAMRAFGISLLLAVPLAAVYLFVLLPRVHDFVPLALVLAPTLVGLGMLMVSPQHALLSLSVNINFINSLALQDRLTWTFADFLNVNLAPFVGLLVALSVTRGLRSMGVETSARRLLRQTWDALARLAEGRGEREPLAFASRMTDRLGLLAPKLAASKDPALAGVSILSELRAGMDLVALRGLRARLSARNDSTLEPLLQALAAHYRARADRQRGPDAEADLLPLLDRTIYRLGTNPAETDAREVSALLGLRRSLFPDTPVPMTIQEARA